VIQRLQSIFLSLAFLLNGGVFFNDLYTHAINDPRQWIGILFATALTLSMLGSLVCIFMYKNRKNQARWVTRVISIQIIAIGFGIGIYMSLGGFGSYLWDETIGLALLFLAFICQLYARKKIKDDIELVKSMDRIR